MRNFESIWALFERFFKTQFVRIIIQLCQNKILFGNLNIENNFFFS